jgi:hypothetical protein
MKLFTTITSERGKPVTKSGNEYIEININTVDRNQPTNRIRIINDEMLNVVYISHEEYIRGKWIEKTNTKVNASR